MDSLSQTGLPPWVVGATAFLAIGAIVFFLWMLFSSEAPSAERRLESLRGNKKAKSALGLDLEPEGKRSEALQAVLSKAEALSKPMQPKNEKEISKLKEKLIQGGFRNESAVPTFLGFKFMGLLVGFFLGGGISLIVYGFTGTAMLRTVTIAGIGMFVPDILLRLIVGRRQEQIFLGLPDALDLMVVCVEAGLGLDQAMRKVTEEMKKSYRVIADEFGLCNIHLQMGRTRSDALQDLGARTGVDDLRQLTGILIQADRFGTGIANALRVQSDAMRTRRRQLAEEKAAKTAVKLIFPLVLFIFPGIFVVLVGPAAITMMDKLLNR